MEALEGWEAMEALEGWEAMSMLEIGGVGKKQKK